MPGPVTADTEHHVVRLASRRKSGPADRSIDPIVDMSCCPRPARLAWSVSRRIRGPCRRDRRDRRPKRKRAFPPGGRALRGLCIGGEVRVEGRPIRLGSIRSAQAGERYIPSTDKSTRSSAINRFRRTCWSDATTLNCTTDPSWRRAAEKPPGEPDPHGALEVRPADRTPGGAVVRR